MRFAALAALIVGGVAISISSGSPQSASSQQAFLDRYCVTCHTESSKEKGLVPVALDKLDLSKISRDAELWEKVLRRIETGVMPPPSAPRPDPNAAKGVTTWLTAELDRAAQSNPNPGRTLLHRLNRTEYANAIRDLLSLEIDAASLLPPDDSAYGFDNIADALGLSPALQERYVSAALKIGALAVGDPRVSPDGTTYRIRQDVSQDRHIEGMPLGTIGGTQVRHNFPLDGEYTFQVKLYRTNLNIMRGLDAEHEIEIAVDGNRVHSAKLGGPEDLEALFQKPTDTGDAVVAAHGDRRALLGRVHAHGAELEDEERLEIASHPLLAEQHRPAVLRLDEHGEDEERGPQQEQAQRGGDDVEGAFHRAPPAMSRTASITCRTSSSLILA